MTTVHQHKALQPPPSFNQVGLAEQSILDDDLGHLVCAMNIKYGEKMDEGEGNQYFPTELFELICKSNAVACANGLVNGELGLKVDLNRRMKGGMFPLEFAACKCYYGLARAFLLHGAQPDLCSSQDNVKLLGSALEYIRSWSITSRVGSTFVTGGLQVAAKDLNYDHTEAFLLCGDDPNLYPDGDSGKLPLVLALQALCEKQCVRDWDATKSVNKLIYIFCLKEMRDPLSTIRLLASRTHKMKEISLQYANEGDVVKLAALLLHEWSSLKHPVRERIVLELHSMDVNPEIALEDYCEMPLLDKRVAGLVSAWKILVLFELYHARIRSFRFFSEGERYVYKGMILEGMENHEVPFAVARAMNFRADAFGPEDLFCDDINCLKPMLGRKEKADLYDVLRTSDLEDPRSRSLSSGLEDAGSPLFKIGLIRERNDSLYTLICRLCTNAGRTYYLETARLRAIQTKDIEKDISNYVKEGRVEELCSLMLLGFLTSNELETLLESFQGDECSKDELELLVRIFQKIGDKLQAYVMIKRKDMVRQGRVVSEIATLLGDAGFPVKCKDCLLRN